MNGTLNLTENSSQLNPFPSVPWKKEFFVPKLTIRRTSVLKPCDQKAAAARLHGH
jgi:hypothetical protein